MTTMTMTPTTTTTIMVNGMAMHQSAQQLLPAASDIVIDHGEQKPIQNIDNEEEPI